MIKDLPPIIKYVIMPTLVCITLYFLYGDLENIKAMKLIQSVLRIDFLLCIMGFLANYFD